MAAASDTARKSCFLRSVCLLIAATILGLFCSQALAGYTHYYTWKQPPDSAALKDCVADMNRLIEARKGMLVSPDLPESKPGELKLGSTNVDFNGIGEDAHEPFEFPYVMPERAPFNFCKTAYKPYDEVVTACLIVARDHFSPSVLEISSDGEWSDWNRGAGLYSSVFGRRARNPMTGHGFEHVSPKQFRFNALISMVLFLAIVLGYLFWQKRSNSYSKAWRRSFD